jgi:adenylate cyclase
VGEQSESTTWIDFLGPAGTVPRVSALDVLEGRVAPGEFRGKRVVIGVTAPGPDVHRTPFERMRGAEVQATALDTILRGGPLRDVPPLLDILAIVLLGAVPAVATLARRRWLALTAVAATALGFLAVAQILFNNGRIIAVVVPLAALLTATLVAVIFASAGVLRARRARAGGLQ